MSSSTDVFHLSVVQDCRRLVPGLHQRENHKVRHGIHTKLCCNFALCLQHDVGRQKLTTISDIAIFWCLVGLVKRHIAFKVSATALRQTFFFQDFLQTRLKVSLPSIVISRAKALHPQTPPRPLLRTQRLYPKGLLQRHLADPLWFLPLDEVSAICLTLHLSPQVNKVNKIGEA